MNVLTYQKIKIEKANDFLVKEGDLVIALTGATIRKFTIIPLINNPLLVNQHVGKFFLGSKPISKLPFIWCLLKQKRIKDEIINRGQGSAQPNVSPKDIENIPIILPTGDIIDEFNNKYNPLFTILIK